MWKVERNEKDGQVSYTISTKSRMASEPDFTVAEDGKFLGGAPPHLNAVPEAARKATNPQLAPLTEEELLKQIEVYNPVKIPTAPLPPARPSPEMTLTTPDFAGGIPRATAVTPIDLGSHRIARISPSASGTRIGSGTPPPPGEKKEKGPTTIDALEATFDQRADVAVFVGEVAVDDPEFKIWCDKLTAYLKPSQKSGGTAAKGAKSTVKSATTPKPATPKAATPSPDGSTPPKKGGGLDHAIAVMLSGGRVKIIQDKVDPDTGKIKHGLGYADRAEYNTDTGDITLYGTPDVTQDQDRCIATAPYTVITLNRDGHMTAASDCTAPLSSTTPPTIVPTGLRDGRLPGRPRRQLSRMQFFAVRDDHVREVQSQLGHHHHHHCR